MRIDVEKFINIKAQLDLFGVTKTQLEKEQDEGSQFGMISAYKKDLPKNENKQRQTALIWDIQNLGLKWEARTGVYDYTLEGSLLVKDISFGYLTYLGRLYEQESVIFKPADGPIGLYNLVTNMAVLLIKYNIEMNAPRLTNRKELEKKKKPLLPQTRIRDTKLSYEFNWSDPVAFSNSPIYEAPQPEIVQEEITEEEEQED